METPGLRPERPAEPVASVARRDIWDAAERAATRARLRADLRRRETLGARQRSALDGLVHALKPDSMDRSYPERHLLAYDLGTALRPASAAIAVGEPSTASHLTWQVSGMGILVHTAMWGSVREAGQLWAAQRDAGVPRPCVVAWLGYHPPGPWGVLSGQSALRGGARLARHLDGWFDYRVRLAAGPAPAAGTGPDIGTATAPAGTAPAGTAPAGTAPAAGTGSAGVGPQAGTAPLPHTAVEAHSYGSVVAARALQILQRREPPRSLDALVVSGVVGLPRDLAEDPGKLGLREEQIYVALAETDYLSRLGRLLSRRPRWTRFTPLEVGADDSRGLAGVVGHNTSRHRPDSGPMHRGFGYRDVGTTSLHHIARATAGLPLD
ncbi:alpha/beta hydrolase [Citricoccus sp. NPDC079358]|uniref:alpha/beta hydrolase n=1 Tax=Citricoccus sp. NPDC079358 TaxID=3154653 RepID=UPI00344DCA8C